MCKGYVAPWSGPQFVAKVIVYGALLCAKGSHGVTWLMQLQSATESCAAYARMKRQGGSSAADLEKAKRETRAAIKSFLMDNVGSWYTDKAFREVAMPDHKQGGSSLERSSRLIQTCYTTDLLELRDSWGYFLGAIAQTSKCIAQGEKINEFEGRCFPSAIANAMDAFQWSGEIDEMVNLFEKSKEVTDSKGKQIIRWPNPFMRPMMTFLNIRNRVVWARRDSDSIASIMNIMEDNVKTFKRELQAVKKHFQSAYDHLLGQGKWTRANACSNGVWDDKICALTPRTCELFRNELPGQQQKLPYAVNNHEEVSFFYAGPDSVVLPHNGGQNGRINIHIGLEGFEGSKLILHTGVNETKVLKWSDKKAMAFGDGWSHEVVNGPTDRYVMIVGVMHPDIDQSSYAEAFTGKTQATAFRPGELERFREAFREKKKRQAKKKKKHGSEKDEGEL